MTVPDIKLKIADTVIVCNSKFPQQRFEKAKEIALFYERFKNFFYNGNRRPDIFIRVEMVDKLPQSKRAKDIFVTYHPEDGEENWRLSKKGSAYIFKSPLKDKEQLMFINKTFDEVTAYLLPKEGRGLEWHIADIIYDFLQILLINYFAQRESGIFLHAIGIKDSGGKGYVFAGKSGAGKTTAAKIWYRHSNATVLNDDRIIIRKIRKKFFVYGSPWHGAFSDYLMSRTEEARLRKLFFIHHSPKNTSKPVTSEKAFKLLYPTTFPTFWDGAGLEKMVSFCEGLLRNTPCFRLGFARSKKIIGFIRSLSSKN